MGDVDPVAVLVEVIGGESTVRSMIGDPDAIDCGGIVYESEVLQVAGEGRGVPRFLTGRMDSVTEPTGVV